MKNARKGSVLAMSAVVLIVLLVLGAALIARTRGVLESSARERDRLLALNAAEAGANLAVYLMASDPVHWTNLVSYYPALQNTDLGNSRFQVRDVTWLTNFTALVRSDGYSKGGRAAAMRTVAVKVRLIPAGWRYALFSGGNIFAGGNSSVHGSMRANGANGITIDTGGSFNFYALNDLDAAETPGFIRDNANGIPPQYEYQRGPAIPDLPQIKYTDFQQTSLFPRARIYNVLPVDPTPGNDPFTDDDVATDPSGGILPKVQADGSINWYYSYNVTKNGGQVNDQWTVDQFNAAFSANPSYLPGLPPKDYAMINWRTGVDQNGDGVIDNYRLHLSGNGTITSTIVVYGDSGDPLNPNDNGSVQIDGGATFEPVTGVALVANGVDFSKLNGNTQIGTQANPALIYASGYANWGSNGTLTTVGCVAVGGSQLATVTIGGNSSHWFNPSFIDKMPENMQLVFTRPTYYSEWLSWQVL